MIVTKKQFIITKRSEKNLLNDPKNQFFSKRFMIVAGFSYKGEIKVKKVDKNVKINYKYYQEYISTPIFKYKILDLHPKYHQSVELHQDKASSYTSQSAITFKKKMKREMKPYPSLIFLLKSIYVSPMGFCAFGLLKSALSKH